MSLPQTILLVEDDQDDKDFFIIALSNIGYATLFDVASNGREAIEKLHESAVLPGVIVMDINMPVMNGIQCLTEMLKDPLINKIPVLILSSDTHQRERVQQLGVTEFIEKSSDLRKLRDQLEQALLKCACSVVGVEP